MKGIVFVGGIPYSGKTTFCRELQKSNSGMFYYIEGDKLFDELMDSPSLFFDFLKKTEPKLYWSTKEFCAKEGILDPWEQIVAMRLFGERYGVKQYVKNMEQYALAAYSFEKIAGLPHGSCPVMEGIHNTKEARQNLYKRMKIYPAIAKLWKKEGHADETPTREDIDSMRKFMVYFNLGPRLSIKRLKRMKGKSKYKHMTTTNSHITKNYDMQEIPEGGEIPNLEIIIIRSQDDIGYAVQAISDAYS